jgi:hypothetical protein
MIYSAIAEDARNKGTWDTTFRRLATKGGEKSGLAEKLLMACAKVC